MRIPLMPIVRAGSWTLYDLANTVYAATLAYLFVPKFVKVSDTPVLLGVATTGSLLLTGLLVPVLGAFCDRTGRARTCLAITTLVCIAAMTGLSVVPGHDLRTLGFLALANVAFQAALVCYNSLLPSVAPTRHAGLVSGIGTGVGYLGTILTLAVLAPVLKSQGFTDDDVIDGAAALFLIAALPCLVLVEDRRFDSPRRMTMRAARQSVVTLTATIRRLPAERNVLLFLLGNFCLLDVLNTAVIYFGVIAQDAFQAQFAEGGLEVLGFHFVSVDVFARTTGLTLNVLAMLCGVLLGVLADRTTAIGTMRLSGWALAIALLGGALTVGRSADAFMLTLLPFGAFGLAGLWTAGRKVVVQLAPRSRRGEYFGLYGLTTKVSVVGTLSFMWIYTEIDLSTALLTQLVPAAIGLALLHTVRVPSKEEEL